MEHSTLWMGAWALLYEIFSKNWDEVIFKQQHDDSNNCISNGIQENIKGSHTIGKAYIMASWLRMM